MQVILDSATEVTVFELVLRWQMKLDVTGRCNDRTRSSYRRIAMQFIGDVACDPDWRGHRDPLQITEDDAVAYVSRFDPRGANRNLVIQALKSLYSFIADREPPVIVRNPFHRINPKKLKYGAAPSMAPGDMAAVLKAAGEVDPRCPWAIQIQYQTACRAGSLLALEPKDLRRTQAGQVIDFREAKGDRPYSVPASAKAVEAVTELRNLLDWTPPTVKHRLPTLVGVRYSAYANWLHRTEDRSGLELRSHLLRHTRITRWAEENVDIRSIVELANWEDPRLLKRYAKASEPNLRAAVELV